VIVKMDGKSIADSSDLPALVADTKPGSTAKLEIMRKATVATSRSPWAR